MPERLKLQLLIVFFLVGCAILNGCLDYVKMDGAMSDINVHPPVIDFKHLSPHPSRLTEDISVGKNCLGQVFKVPPIKDRNHKDILHYLWFLDNKLVLQAKIKPESRGMAILSFGIDEQFLLSHFSTKIPKDFFDRTHIIDFYVSDIEYVIPETRYLGDEKYNETDHVDHAYWIISFSNDPC